MLYYLLLSLFVGLVFFALLGPIAAMAAFISGLAAIGIIRWNYKRKLRFYGDRLENFYEWQQSPTDKDVMIRAQEHQQWLELSGNAMNVRVVTIFFQDVYNPSETWEEYQDRVKAAIANDRILRHQEIEQGQGRDYYLREMHRQKGIRYPEEQAPTSFFHRLMNRKKKTA